MYTALEASEEGLRADLEKKQAGKVAGGAKFAVPKDDERAPRTEEEMEKEAKWLQTFF